MTRVHAQAAILDLLIAPPPGVPLTAEVAHHIATEVWAREHAFNDREERRRRRDQPEHQVPAEMIHSLLLWLMNEKHNPDFCGATIALIFVVLQFKTDPISLVWIIDYSSYTVDADAQPEKHVDRFYGEIIEKKFHDARGGVANRGPGR